MAVAQLAEQLLPTTNAKGLNPINVTVLLHRKDEYLEKGWKMPIYKKYLIIPSTSYNAFYKIEHLIRK